MNAARKAAIRADVEVAFDRKDRRNRIRIARAGSRCGLGMPRKAIEDGARYRSDRSRRGPHPLMLGMPTSSNGGGVTNGTLTPGSFGSQKLPGIAFFDPSPTGEYDCGSVLKRRLVLSGSDVLISSNVRSLPATRRLDPRGDHFRDHEGQPLESGTTGSLFIDSLPVETRARLTSRISRVKLSSGQVLSIAGEPIKDIYFPIESVISTLTQMRDGYAVEVGLTGREGLTGFSLVFGTSSASHLVTAQVPDSAFRVDVTTFRSLLASDQRLHERVLAYAGYAFNAATQFAACNRLHNVEERFARWMLMASDRVAKDDFMLTQEFAAEMLGVRRPSISLVAGAMSRAGIIRYRRGAMSILDREALREAACECYVATDSNLRQSMGYGLAR